MIAMISVRAKRNRGPINPALRKYYEDTIAAGKAKKVALGAVMRKILHYVYAMPQDGKPFDLQTPQQHVQAFKAA